jgi:hypothetical protein
MAPYLVQHHTQWECALRSVPCALCGDASVTAATSEAHRARCGNMYAGFSFFLSDSTRT